MQKLLLLLSLVFSVASMTVAQQKTTITEGRRYVVAFPQVWASPSEKPLPQPMTLFIGSKYDTRVTITTPSFINDAPRINKTYTVQKNSILKVPIDVAYMNKESERIRGYGIEVVGDKPITVYTYQAWITNGEMARQLPVFSWGKNYFTMNFYLDRYGMGADYKYRPSQTLIISAYDNTVVTYRPTVATEGGLDALQTPKDGSTTVVLNAGETFLIRSKIIASDLKNFSSDMSGTHIIASNPIGVISGHTKVGIMIYPDILPSFGRYASEAHAVRNNVHDAMFPVEMAGYEFVAIPSMYTAPRVTAIANTEVGVDNDSGDVLRFLATEDNTAIGVVNINGAVLNITTLNRGQSHIITAFEHAAKYVANKPILVGQYGKSYAKITHQPRTSKDGDYVQGNPTVESGLPMMECVPPISRWADYGVFHSPEGVDNFINIVFSTNDSSVIRMDGQTLSFAFGDSITPIAGTSYAYIRALVGSGDHFITSDSGSGARWSAWTYGSRNGLQQGMAYGTFISANYTLDCDDSVSVVSESSCGDIRGFVNVYSQSVTCIGVFDIFLQDDVNYTLTYGGDVNVSQYVISIPFTITAIDRTKPASAKLIAITKSGRLIEKTFVYQPNAIIVTPTFFDFGTIPYGDTVCSTFTVRNVGTKDFYIASIRVKNNPQFITVFPTNIFINSGQTVTFDVCVRADFYGSVIDSLIFSYAGFISGEFCYDVYPVKLNVHVDIPDFYATDQDWGTIGKNQTVTKNIILANVGNSDVIVYGFTPISYGPYFSNITLPYAFPFTMKKNARVSVSVDYNPNGEVNTPHTQMIDWVTNATKTKLYSKLMGQGADSELEITNIAWTERVIDQWQLDIGITSYVDTLHISNVGNRDAIINSIQLNGADVTAFSILSNPTLPTTVGIGSVDMELMVAFVPSDIQNTRDAERYYTADVVVNYTVDSVIKIVTAKLLGTALQPRLSATGYDFGIQQVGTTVSAPIYIRNVDSILSNVITGNLDGSMDLTLFELIIPNNNPFVWAATGTKTLRYPNGILIASGDVNSLRVDVQFTPTIIGTWSTPYTVLYNGHIVVSPILTGTAKQMYKLYTDSLSLQTWYNHRIIGEFAVHSSMPGLISVSDPFGGDYTNFKVLGYRDLNGVIIYTTTQIPINANNVTKIIIEFTPSSVTSAALVSGQNLNSRLPFRLNSFTTNIEVVDEISGLKDTAHITGDGAYLETTVYVPDYNINLGEIVDAYIYLRGYPQNVDVGNVNQFRLRVSYDNRLLKPLSVIQENTQIVGWDLLSYTVLNDNMIEMDVKNKTTSSILLQMDDPIVGIKFQPLLTAITTSKIDVQLYWIDVEQSNIGDSQYAIFNYEPGSVAVNGPCAGGLRLIRAGDTRYYISTTSNVVDDIIIVEYGVGISSYVELNLVNTFGDIIPILYKHQDSGVYNIDLDVSGIPSGVYYIVFKSADYMATPIKIVKQH